MFYLGVSILWLVLLCVYIYFFRRELKQGDKIAAFISSIWMAICVFYCAWMFVYFLKG